MPANNPQSEYVDLRSDTVTRPTPEMYEAMRSAPLGDDVLGDDPTVTRLELLASEKTGMEAAVFVPSGTMGNQIAILCHTQRGDAILVEEEAHIAYYECAAPAVLGGVLTWTLPSKLGVMDPDIVEARILRGDLHTPATTLLCVENTHNRAGGTVVPLQTLGRYRDLCHKYAMKLHIDGARVFHAAVAQEVPVSVIAQQADSVSFCLSKGLGSPVGSLLCGRAQFIEKARQWRKRLGGGMRQSGILAACGIVSLTKMVDRLKDDHCRARALASIVEKLPGLAVDWSTVQTNLIFVKTEAPAQDWVDRLKEKKVWVSAYGPHLIRMVLHPDIDDASLDRAIEGLKACAQVA